MPEAARRAPRLRCVALAAGYGMRVVVRDVELTVDGGEAVLIEGPNGSGKTTLLRTIAGLLPVIAGTISLDGSMQHRDVHGLRRAGVHYVPQGQRIFASMTVRENLALAASGIGAQLTAAAIEMLALPLVTQVLDRDAGTLSAGQRQVVSTAMGLVGTPGLLLFDEPFAALDDSHVTQVSAALRRALQRGAAVIFAEHRRELTSSLASRTCAIVDGRLVERR